MSGRVHPVVVPPVACLCVLPDSHYRDIPGCDCYDEARDARTWPGGCPVVAHPPCRTWGKLRRFATRAPAHEHGLALWAVDQVRTWGGVLEHPDTSRIWRRLPVVDGLPDAWGGHTIEVDQYHWGHRARKRTRLYIVGTRLLPPMPHRNGEPTHVVSSGYGVRSTPGHSHRSAKPEITKRERLETPPAFAAWLVEVARRCSGHNTSISGGGTPSVCMYLLH